MSVMMGDLYDALKNAAADEDKARKAATEIASQERLVHDRVGSYEADIRSLKSNVQQLKTDSTVLKWMMGTVATLQVMTLGSLIGLLWKVFPVGR